MTRNNNLYSKAFIEIHGEIIPFLTTDDNGEVTLLVSKDDQDIYVQSMLNNMGDAASRYYTLNPNEI